MTSLEEPAGENLSILIPTRNRPDILATTLEELRKARFGNTPLFVYDDCSADAAAVRATCDAWPSCRLIRGEQRVGQAGGRNVLLNACGTTWALMLEDDSFATAAAPIATLVAELAGAKCRALVTFQCRSMADGRLAMPPTRTAGPTPSFLGGASLAHVPSLLAIGGFRPFFVYGYEEPELALRLWSNAYEIWYEPGIVIEHNHFEHPSENRDHTEYDFLYARNCILMYSLNTPIWMGLPWGLFSSVRCALGSRRNVLPKMKGILAGLWMTCSHWRDRSPTSAKRALRWRRMMRNSRK